MPPAKKATAANRLGPTENKAGSQPPWAMVSADGADMLYPQSAEQAREYLGQGAKPVDPALWPWASEVPLAGDGEPPIQDQLSSPPVKDGPPKDQTGPIGGLSTLDDTPGASESAAEPPTDPESLDVLGCPTPALCWPLGLPSDVSYVTCTHGGWAIGD